MDKYIKELVDSINQSLSDKLRVCDYPLQSIIYDTKRQYGLGFIEYISNEFKSTRRVLIKLKKNKYKCGDIVFLEPKLANLNWRIRDYLDTAFIVISIPSENNLYNMYKVQILAESFEDPLNVDEEFLSLDKKYLS